MGEEKPYLGDKGYFPCQYPMATYAAMVSYLDYQVGCIVQELKDRQELTVYCNSRYTSSDVKLPDVKLVRIPTLPGKHLQPVSLFILSALHALFKGNYDLIHLHNVEACFVLPLLRLRYRVIATSHGSPIRAARNKWGIAART